MNTQSPRGPSERLLFLLIALLNGLIYLFLVADHRHVRGHETATYCALQHTFASGAAQGGIPLWLPYATQGTVSTWAAAGQGGLFQCAFLLLASAFRGAEFLPFFHLGLYFDELVFLAGVWLLARRFYPSPWTVFFVAVGASGSCLWADHAWANFRAVHAVPLAIALVHGFLDDGRRGRLLLAVNLLSIQAALSPPADALLPTGIVLLYFLGRSLVHPVRPAVPLRLERGDAAWGLGALASVGLSMVALTAGTSEITGGVVENPFRGLLGGVHPARPLDLALGLSPSLDHTLFAGYFTLGLAVLGLGRLPAPIRSRLLGTLILSLGAIGLLQGLLRFLAPAWAPLRLAPIAAPLLRLSIIFISGAGVEGLLRREYSGQRRAAGIAWGMALLAMVLGALSWFCVSGRDFAEDFVQRLLGPEASEDKFVDVNDTGLVSELLGVSAFLAALAAASLGLAASGRRAAVLAPALVFFLHPLDVFGWKSRMFWLKTFPLTVEQRALHRLGPLPYIPKRSARLEPPRAAVATPPVFGSTALPYGRGSWLEETHHRSDSPASLHPTDYWMRPLDDLIRAYRQDPWRDGVLRFPDGPAPGRICGLELDKLQVFSRALRAERSAIARWLARPEFAGDLLFLEGDGPPPPSLTASDRLPIPPTVLSFDANHLRVRLHTSGGGWLYYADVWHPSWSASLNGRPVPVERANLAYKAVPLDPGENLVEFRFHAPVRRVAYTLLSLNALFWLGFALAFPFRLGRGRAL